MNKYPACFGGAVWIAPTTKVASPIIKKTFHIENLPNEAKIHITGLGYFEAKLNGVQLTEDRLIPPASDYYRRDYTTAYYPVRDHFTHRI